MQTVRTTAGPGPVSPRSTGRRLLVAAILVALAAVVVVTVTRRSGDEAKIDDAVSALDALADPESAAPLVGVEPLEVWQGGEAVTRVDQDSADDGSVWVYSPGGKHPDGWLGTGETVVVRYWSIVGVDYTLADACQVFGNWVVSNGGERPDCAEQTTALARSGGAISDNFPEVTWSAPDGSTLSGLMVLASAGEALESAIVMAYATI